MNRYRQFPIIQDPTPRRGTVVYPDIPTHPEDTYVIATLGDRFDILAQAYYQDSSLWWVVASANPDIARSSINITPGVQIRIPFSKARILDLFQSVNVNR